MRNEVMEHSINLHYGDFILQNRHKIHHYFKNKSLKTAIKDLKFC